MQKGNVYILLCHSLDKQAKWHIIGKKTDCIQLGTDCVVLSCFLLWPIFLLNIHSNIFTCYFMNVYLLRFNIVSGGPNCQWSNIYLFDLDAINFVSCTWFYHVGQLHKDKPKELKCCIFLFWGFNQEYGWSLFQCYEWHYNTLVIRMAQFTFFSSLF